MLAADALFTRLQTIETQWTTLSISMLFTLLIGMPSNSSDLSMIKRLSGEELKVLEIYDLIKEGIAETQFGLLLLLTGGLEYQKHAITMPVAERVMKAKFNLILYSAPRNRRHPRLKRTSFGKVCRAGTHTRTT